MKRLILGAAIAAIATASYIAISADAPDRPAGLAAKDWIPVGNSIGIVLVSPDTTQRTIPLLPSGEATVELSGPNQIVPGTALLLKPPVSGYFMVKGASGWTRLVVIEPVKGPADVG